MDKWEYIKAISKASDKSGSLLVDMMEQYHVNNLKDIPEEQIKEFYERKVKKNDRTRISEIGNANM